MISLYLFPRRMSENYSAATVTPINDVKRDPENLSVKTEPASSRVNGYGMATISSASTSSLAAAGVSSMSSVEHQSESSWYNGRDQQCCLVENGRRCVKPAGNASYSKRIQKTVTQKKLKLYMDNGASSKTKHIRTAHKLTCPNL